MILPSFSCYTAGMPHALRFVILCSALLAAALGSACADDSPQRPADGSQGPYESCAWDDQVVPELCAEFLVCPNGFCTPRCERDSECPSFEGFESFCSGACRIACDEKRECPNTNEADFVGEGAPLICGADCQVDVLLEG